MSQTQTTGCLACFPCRHPIPWCVCMTSESGSHILQVVSQTFPSLAVRKKQASYQICFFEVECMSCDVVPEESKANVYSIQRVN